MNQGKSYYSVVASILNRLKPATVLDAPCGNGWLRKLLDYECQVDGLDLFAPPPTVTAPSETLT